jgi:hypothetical protein
MTCLRLGIRHRHGLRHDEHSDIYTDNSIACVEAKHKVEEKDTHNDTDLVAHEAKRESNRENTNIGKQEGRNQHKAIATQR